MKTSQWIIITVVGLATAVGTAVATVQIQTATQPTANSTITPTTPASTAKPTTPASTIPPIAKAEPVVVTPQVAGCRISSAVVNDPDPPLNVRSTPQVADNNIVGKLNNGTFLGVIEEKNNWLHISDPVEGWVAKNRTDSTCAVVKKRINFAPQGDSAIVKGRIIGGGSHRYILNANQGQTLSVKKLDQQGVFPTIVDPNGNILAGNPYTDGNRTEWTAPLPVAGDYILEMDSNFRGFTYEFSVQVK